MVSVQQERFIYSKSNLLAFARVGSGRGKLPSSSDCAQSLLPLACSIVQIRAFDGFYRRGRPLPTGKDVRRRVGCEIGHDSNCQTRRM